MTHPLAFAVDSPLLTGTLLLVALTLALYLLYYRLLVVQTPKLIAGNPKWASFLTEAMSLLSEPYYPTPWCIQSHLMTAAGSGLRGLSDKLKYHRESLPTADGGRITLDYYDPEGASPPGDARTPILLFLPGITGHSQAEYLRTLVPTADRIGYQAVVLNYRGLDGHPILTPRLYCGASHEDLEVALKHIRTQVGPETMLVAVGLSMGATVLSGYLTATGGASQVDAALLISTCWDFTAGSLNLEEGHLNRQVNAILTSGLIDAVGRHRAFLEAALPGAFDYETIGRCRTLRTFDEAFTRRMFGYESCDAYYAASTHLDVLDRIAVPTLALNAADDMILPEAHLPLGKVTGSSHLALAVTARGGHIGFLNGLLPLPGRASGFFLERFTKQYLSALYKLTDNPRTLLGSGSKAREQSQSELTPDGSQKDDSSASEDKSIN